MGDYVMSFAEKHTVSYTGADGAPLDVSRTDPLPIESSGLGSIEMLLVELLNKQDLTNRYLSLLTSANLGEQNDGT